MPVYDIGTQKMAYIGNRNEACYRHSKKFPIILIWENEKKTIWKYRDLPKPFCFTFIKWEKSHFHVIFKSILNVSRYSIFG